MKQLERLKVMQPSSAEYTVTRTYLEWLVELPWSISTEDKLDIQEARDILNADHYDLEKVKKRILEYLAVRKLKSDKKGPILCLVGPARRRQDVARAGRSRARWAASSSASRSAACATRRRSAATGAPTSARCRAASIQGMKKAGTNNPVFMLDEIDKLGHDFRGDPAAALLEVLDPEQNNTFSDHYLEVPFDLSKVMFVATANIIDPIPPALRDRLEVLELPGYTREEKLNISKQFLVPKQLEEHGLDDGAARRSTTPRSPRSSTATRARPASATSSARSPTSSARVAVLVAEGKAQPTERVTHERIAEFLGPGEVHLRGRGAHRGAGRGDGPGLDAGRRRHPLHRGDEDARQGAAGADRPARRRDEGVGAGGAVVRPRRAPSGSASRRTSSRRPTSTSTSRRARSRRTARRRASRCSSRWRRC